MYSKNNSRSSENVVCGRNPVLELLKAGRRTVNKIMVSRTARGVVVSEIINLAKQKGIALHSVPPEKLDKFSESSQGIVAEVSPVQYTELSDLIERSKKSLKPLLVILDGTESYTVPYNCTQMESCWSK